MKSTFLFSLQVKGWMALAKLLDVAAIPCFFFPLGNLSLWKPKKGDLNYTDFPVSEQWDEHRAILLDTPFSTKYEQHMEAFMHAWSGIYLYFLSKLLLNYLVIIFNPYTFCDILKILCLCISTVIRSSRKFTYANNRLQGMNLSKSLHIYVSLYVATYWERMCKRMLYPDLAITVQTQ